jgi:hypothetical protein
MGAQNLFDLELQQTGFFLFGKLDANALGAVASGACRRNPGHPAGDRIALRIVGQRQQHLHIVAQLVVAHGRDEHAAIGEDRDIGGIQRALFLDG